uniref:Uncharacterized protein n=1 Tax=Chromera velia CCMP2878 TaxID=1169474 RepID=A0A0G4GQB7_9ALVE|eukprot:Cvel_22863.t1-p1 / transcript=Cvel_22863.t1 / gene=Cvel_22863 / organism=Chromera_velia_CCMP2878 / gene_product=hypothetical protein / transcript_product=hypothetical protein / location=Cvel_scaffold2295:978-2808(-) / protein_length=381 / sequence_SO=supercontig / SO=protein_coding / is_pseudo=false
MSADPALLMEDVSVEENTAAVAAGAAPETGTKKSRGSRKLSEEKKFFDTVFSIGVRVDSEGQLDKVDFMVLASAFAMHKRRVEWLLNKLVPDSSSSDIPTEGDGRFKFWFGVGEKMYNDLVKDKVASAAAEKAANSSDKKRQNVLAPDIVWRLCATEFFGSPDNGSEDFDKNRNLLFGLNHCVNLLNGAVQQKEGGRPSVKGLRVRAYPEFWSNPEELDVFDYSVMDIDVLQPLHTYWGLDNSDVSADVSDDALEHFKKYMFAAALDRYNLFLGFRDAKDSHLMTDKQERKSLKQGEREKETGHRAKKRRTDGSAAAALSSDVEHPLLSPGGSQVTTATAIKSPLLPVLEFIQKNEEMPEVQALLAKYAIWSLGQGGTAPP